MHYFCTVCIYTQLETLNNSYNVIWHIHLDYIAYYIARLIRNYFSQARLEKFLHHKSSTEIT